MRAGGVQTAPDRNTQVAAGAAVVVMGCLPGFATAALATRIGRDFSFDQGDLGLAVGLLYGVCALISARCGRLVTRIGPKRGVCIAAASTAGGCFAIAAFADSTGLLLVLLAITTVGNAMGVPVAIGLFQTELSPRRQGTAAGVLQAGAPVGALVAGLTLPLIAIPFGWRWVYVAIAMGSVLAAVAVHPHERAAGRAHGRGGASVVDGRSRVTVRWLAVIAALACAAPMAMISFLVVYASDNGIAEGVAGVLLAAVSASAVAARIGLGLHADRSGSTQMGLTAAMLTASSVGYLALMSGVPVAIGIGALVAGAVGWAWPGPLTVSCIRVAPQAVPWAVGVMMSGLFAGCVAGPVIAGALANHGAFKAVWCVTAAFSLGAAALALYTRTRLPSAEEALPASA